MGFFKKITGMDSDKTNINVSDESQEESKKPTSAEAGDENEEWLADNYEEGQLAIDVYQNSDNIVVKSTIAGVKPEDIDISVNNDMLTIRGKREMKEEITEDDYFYQECYWGGFSRSIILPMEVQTDKIDAILENGVLTVILPKAKSSKQVSIKVKEK